MVLPQGGRVGRRHVFFFFGGFDPEPYPKRRSRISAERLFFRLYVNWRSLLPYSFNYFAMEISVEISMYPLNDTYIPPIEQFISNLRRHNDLRIVTNSMSTQIVGPYERVMLVVQAEMKKAFGDSEDAIVMVAKFINKPLF